MTWVIRSSDPCSRPLARLTTGIHGWIHGRACSSVERTAVVGTPTMSSSAWATAFSRSAVAISCSGSVKPGQVRLVGVLARRSPRPCRGCAPTASSGGGRRATPPSSSPTIPPQHGHLHRYTVRRADRSWSRSSTTYAVVPCAHGASSDRRVDDDRRRTPAVRARGGVPRRARRARHRAGADRVRRDGRRRRRADVPARPGVAIVANGTGSACRRCHPHRDGRALLAPRRGDGHHPSLHRRGRRRRRIDRVVDRGHPVRRHGPGSSMGALRGGRRRRPRPTAGARHLRLRRCDDIS